jgi:hypothetical protein
VFECLSVMGNDNSCRHSHVPKIRCIKFLTLPIVFCDDLANKSWQAAAPSIFSTPRRREGEYNCCSFQRLSQRQAIEHPHSTVNKFGIKQVTFTGEKSNIDTKPICVHIKSRVLQLSANPLKESGHTTIIHSQRRQRLPTLR